MGTEMKAYIGTKIILAEKMTDSEFNTKFKGAENDPRMLSEMGYHVQYSNPDGSTYDSWSPANVFERAYREVSKDEKKLLIN